MHCKLHMSSVRPTGHLSVTLVDQDHVHIGWKCWKLTAQTFNPTPSLLVAQRPSTCSQGKHSLWGNLGVKLRTLNLAGTFTGPSEQKPIRPKNLGEKGAWAYTVTGQFFKSTPPPIISETSKATNFKF